MIRGKGEIKEGNEQASGSTFPSSGKAVNLALDVIVHGRDFSFERPDSRSIHILVNLTNI